MIICPLCGNPADKTNSHLIPWFLIKDVVTHMGNGVRDTEISFTVSPSDFTRVFTGRSVLPETIEELGDLSDLEKDNVNPYTRDNMWCRKCEEKFSRLEALFASTFNLNRLNNTGLINTPHKGHSIIVSERLDYSIYQLFIQSIFWRCSVGNFDEFSLSQNIEMKIKENLILCFKRSDFLNLQGQDILVMKHQLPLVTSVLHPNDGDSTARFILINRARKPYFISAGSWLFQLYENEKDVRTANEWLYGLRKGIDTPSLYQAVVGKSHLLLINESISERFSQNQVKYHVEKKILALRKKIRIFYLRWFGKKADDRMVNHIQGRFFFYYNQDFSELESFARAFFDISR